MDDDAPLVRAAHVARELNQATDVLNTAVSELEAVLIRIGLGVTASVVLFSDELGTDSLVWTKWDGKWQLLVEHSRHDRPEDDNTWTSLRSTSRETRLRAVKMLPKLLATLVEAAEQEIGEVRAATADLRSLAASAASNSVGKR